MFLFGFGLNRSCSSRPSEAIWIRHRASIAFLPGLKVGDGDSRVRPLRFQDQNVNYIPQSMITAADTETVDAPHLGTLDPLGSSFGALALKD